MSKVFTRISRDIIMAVKDAGPNPESNYRLKLLIQNAKAANMPKDNVERAIKKASSNEQANYDVVVYEGYGAHGIAVLVETATDNTTRTVANLRNHFNKCNGTLGTNGSVAFMFEHKAHFKIAAGEIDIEEFELEMIDFGVEEIFKDDEEDAILLYGPFEEFGNISRGLDEKSLEILESGTEYIPTDTKEIGEEELKDIEKLLERLDEDDDVSNVYTTMR